MIVGQGLSGPLVLKEDAAGYYTTETVSYSEAQTVDRYSIVLFRQPVTLVQGAPVNVAAGDSIEFTARWTFGPENKEVQASGEVSAIPMRRRSSFELVRRPIHEGI